MKHAVKTVLLVSALIAVTACNKNKESADVAALAKQLGEMQAKLEAAEKADAGAEEIGRLKKELEEQKERAERRRERREGGERGNRQQSSETETTAQTAAPATAPSAPASAAAATTAEPAKSTTAATTTPAASTATATPAASTSSGGFQMSGTTLTKYTGSGGNVTIPNGVTAIGQQAFRGSNITSVTIPDSVTSIEMLAFADCRNLASVTIGNGVTSITQGAFVDCLSLTAINVDSGNTVYSSADGVVYNKNKTILILYPSGKKGAFTIPNGVVSIGEAAFAEHKSITSVIIPNSITSIGKSAFENSTSLASVTIGNGVTNIGESAFAGCTSLASIIIPDSVTSIGRGAFCASGLTSVTIPGSVTRIEGIEKMGSSYGGTFENCQRLTSVTIGSRVTYIGPAALGGCTNLTSVTFLGGMASFDFLDGNVGRGAFGYIGDLDGKYFDGGAGTYKTTPVSRGPRGTVWTKQ